MPDRKTRIRRAVSRSPLAPLAALPVRLARVARHDAKVLRESARWLVTSREHHNYTYDLTKLNLEHLAWFVSVVAEVPVADVRGWIAEIESDTALREHIMRTTAGAARRGLADKHVRYARRLGWYALIRARKPQHVVETGVDKGLGTCVIAAALLRNAAEGHPGRVTSLDINPEAGYLAKAQPWADVVDLVIGDSIASIGALDRPVDMFLHDSDHSAAHEQREFTAIEPRLADGALLLTDNVTYSTVLLKHAEKTGRRFLAFKEQPLKHWYPGDGIGAAWR
ncbi:class I SAM-dependent methyltransferase [Catellatospora sp. NPDC049609]|uniref:class I SAM-dependent methyltransferase n=1 Tax=Catellatospora sp. NPDC049609 TaxID=3155505 RepID=UPI0034243ACD